MADKFTTVAAFEYVADLEIFKLKLESEGIQVFVKDGNIVNSDPLISNAVGGAKIQVFTEDEERAREIYDSIRSYAIGDNGQPITCPNCKAQKSESYYERKSIFHKLFPFFEKRKFKCLNCNIITKPY
ncbi:DUF2007 domain-containing protein [Cellulophaga baltica]|uniref:DUF2007 domain-containing protein n=1 Tax=Cellulophaga TaxID=104264 RepID=UPI001C079EE9|nr:MULTISPECIES: DUF2007 domain-containing protein [Cellulophaga]MBU2995631.1 DUF2007 domain-containing protein [Cellulophaga baltica]MDO6767025.1 DUF2007 domain-containing protein [Cellulophaga sp. 1_MG-2023]